MGQVGGDVEAIKKQVQLMKAHALDPDAQIAALRALVQAVEVTEPQFREFDSEGGPSAVLSAIVLHPGRIELQELAITLICAFCASCKTCASIEAFWDAGGLLVVLSALRGRLATQSLQHKACELLGYFALIGGEEEMMNANAAEAIVACMDANPDHANIQHEGVTVLTCLARKAHGGMRQVLLDKGCFKALFAYAAKRFDEGCDRTDAIVPMLEKFVREERQRDQVLHVMRDGALDLLLACLARSPNSPLVSVMRALAEVSSRHKGLKALLRDAGVFEKLVQRLLAEPEDDDDDGVCAETCEALCELAETCEDILGNNKLAEKLDCLFFFHVSLMSGRRCAVVVNSYADEGTLIATASRKLQLAGNVQDAGVTLLLGNEPVPGGFVTEWGLQRGHVYDIQLVYTKRRPSLGGCQAVDGQWVSSVELVGETELDWRN